MFTLAISIIVLGLVALSDYQGEFNLGLGGPLIVDALAWYVVGAYLGVFPTL